MRRRAPAFAIIVALLVIDAAQSAEVPAADRKADVVVVDCATTIGTFRPLNGVNKGPLEAGGIIDLSDRFRELGIASVRLHDCHWPNPDVVDVHAVFPDMGADPERADAYDFRRTDEYVAATLAADARLVFRLGESIEHAKTKYHVHPPADPAKWAAVCVGIVRHYNQGWADGHRYGIRDWEIWNEPDNRPAMWTGSDADYFRLYAAAARAIKARFPDLRVGGPAVGNTGRLTDTGALEPSPFVAAFLDACRRESLPLDFFSWHAYEADPRRLVARARGVRALLDARGFGRTESHLNEWNYLPDDDWAPAGPGAASAADRQRFYERVGGAEGAAFAGAALLLLQDAPIDGANYFAADTGWFGLFNTFGVPRKPYYAFKAFKALLDTPVRLAVTGADARGAPFVAAGATRDRSAVAVLACRLGPPGRSIDLAVKSLPWEGATAYEVYTLDADHDLTRTGAGECPPRAAVRLAVPLEPHGVCVVKLHKRNGRGP